MEKLAEDVPVYEIVPSDSLPLLDLSRSVGGQLLTLVRRLRRCQPNQVANATPREVNGIERLLQDADAPLESLWFNRISLIAFCIGIGLAAIVCLVPQASGAVCAIVGLVLTLPLAVLSLAFLRFDMLKLVVTTYDFWFYSLVNTLGAGLLASGFTDARVCLAVIVWLGNVHTIVVDANTRFICYLNTVSIAVVVLNITIVIAIETQRLDAWQSQTLRLRLHHTDSIMTTNLLSNTLTTMTILVARNAYRRHTEITEQRKIGCPMLRCINYRCRVKLAAVDEQRRKQLDGLTATQKIYYAQNCSQSSFPISQMHYVRCQALFDASHTVIFTRQQCPRQWPRAKQTVFVGLGGAGLALTTAVFGLYPSRLVRPCGILGLVTTLAFLSFTLGLFHRNACRGIVLSFDYVFVSLQLTLGLVSAAMLLNWDARCTTLVSVWLWLHWVLTIDTLTPLVKHRLGVPIKLLIVPVMVLFLAVQIAVVSELVWRDRWGLQDRVVASFFGRVDLRLVPFFASRLGMTLLWSLRLLWRILTSNDGDAIVQLGRVAFRYTAEFKAAVKEPPKVERIPKIRGAPGAAQVAPATTF